MGLNMLSRKSQLSQLVEKYTLYKEEGRSDLSSEETIRTWINQLLAIFDWDVMDTSQILQEKILSREEKVKVYAINSTSTRPDYTFKVGKEKLTFLDAKALSVNLKNDKKSAFQIKSYGWSISAPCAFITNFEEFAIYDCSYTPIDVQDADYGRIYLSMEEYVENFELLEQHLLRKNICNGELDKIYGKNITKAEKTIDVIFAEQLSTFRLSLANDILQKNRTLVSDDLECLSYLTQVIINRVLFIRICEARRIEKEGLLQEFYTLGFWNQFKISSYNDFYEHYDGPLFDRIHLFQEIEISDEVFRPLLDLLYYPSPYRFDVIPTKLLSDIYEIFLSKKLIIEDDIVNESLKLEYIKSKGAVSTPKYLVEDLLKRTIVSTELLEKNMDEIFDIKILDFACGSGIFLIEIFEYLETQLIKSYKQHPNLKYKKLFYQYGEEIILTIKGKRYIIKNCIYGIDIDQEAYEVAKMSLSLKIIDNLDFFESYQELGIFGSKILNSVGENIKCGNTLIDSDIMEKYPQILKDEEQLFRTNPFDWKSEDGFNEIFQSKGGFDFIVGNPPYVEVKNYNEVYPLMHRYIKEQYATTKNGKIDLSIVFIERGFSLLNAEGKMGLIVQNRWFKTDYGKRLRKFITTNKFLAQVINFEANNIFKNRITYISSLILSKEAKNTVVFKKISQNIEELPSTLRELSPCEENSQEFDSIASEVFNQNPWNFEDSKLLAITAELQHKFGSFGAFATVRVGIQVLWDKAYHIKVKSINEDGTLTGDTGVEENITIEVDACRPLILNKKFYPFCGDGTDTYVIFPYEIEEGKSRAILFNEFSNRYPLTGNYLSSQKELIQRNVETFSDEEWHLYTRANNHQRIEPKVMIPMTANDTFANVTFNPLNYCDNANMFFIDIDKKLEDNLYAIAGVINSTIFSVMARSIALKQQNGYFKFNKQFIEPIPFPKEIFEKNTTFVSTIATLSQSIQEKQEAFKYAIPKQKNILKTILIKLWKDLDECVFELYELSDTQKTFFLDRGRNIDRIEVLN
ncbi:MAG TPA: restriction endonuclease subunit M [Campylobacterales bacterium]|nr:restriction endonuclease subunit M [Campylobacterales bacterium]